jgi:hypothetical protein
LHPAGDRVHIGTWNIGGGWTGPQPDGAYVNHSAMGGPFGNGIYYLLGPLTGGRDCTNVSRYALFEHLQGNKRMTEQSYEALVREAIARLETFDARDISAVSLFEEIARRAPAELSALASLDAREGASMWLRLPTLGAVAIAHLLVASMEAEDAGDAFLYAKLSSAGIRMQEATAALAGLTSERILGKVDAA